MQLAHQSSGKITRNEIGILVFPRDEAEPRFHDYITRLSHSTVQVVALVEISIAVLLHAGWLAMGTGSPGALTGQTAALLAIGALTFVLARTAWSRRHPRLLTGISVWFAAAALLWSAMLQPDLSHADQHTLAGAILLVLTATAVTPFLPWHALSLGLAVEGMYILTCELAAHWEISSIGAAGGAHDVLLIMLSLLAAGIAAANYGHRRAEYAATQHAVRVAETLTGAQLRAQLAENAISVGKMAAALSHEINSPMGALRSSIDTLLALTDRLADCPSEKRDQLQKTRAELKLSISESAERIDQVTQRLRRFVSLEEAELKSADINELLADVALLHQERLDKGHVRLEFNLQKSLPPLICRPQLLTAAFSSVLSNAIEALNGDGRVSIETRGRGDEVEIAFRDNGRGMNPADVETIFDPSFKVAGSRVSSGNWSLFNSRQIVYEHGGEILVHTAEGEGTLVLIRLPLAGAG